MVDEEFPPVRDAVILASEYTHGGIRAAFPVGKGHGPLNHMHNSAPKLLQEYALSLLSRFTALITVFQAF